MRGRFSDEIHQAIAVADLTLVSMTLKIAEFPKVSQRIKNNAQSEVNFRSFLLKNQIILLSSSFLI